MIGQTLGHYRILEQIGAGGMGVVYRARDERLDRDVALKVLPRGALADDAARRRFRKEALALAKLAHPNIAHIYDFDTQDGADFLVMEFIAGTTLANRVAAGSLPEKETLAFGAQIAAALEEAHDRGVIHRDLKPGNILVTSKGQAKVLDFGLARLLRPQGGAEVTQTFTETQAGAGTLPYMAPEQLRGEALDGRTDIHALGCVLYELATGRRAFAEDLMPRLLQKILNEAPPLPRATNPRISAELERITLKCLAKDPEDRYQSAKEVGVDLRRLATPTAASAAAARPAPAQVGWRKAGISAAVGAVAVVLLLLVALNVAGLRDRLFSKAGPPQIRSLAVLPLENLSGDPAQEYFADGMTEQLITDLAQVSALKVISRTSVMQYKGARRLLPEITKQLGVDAVIEGSVQRAGERVRITAQLIEAATDRHLWARSYERDMRDVLTLQDELARAIASEIRVQLTPQEQARLASARPVNPEAHELYLRGRYFWNQRTLEAYEKGRRYFEQAIEKDPNYALAHVGLADSYSIMTPFANVPPRETFTRAREAAQKALELDETLAEAHASLAFIFMNYDWDWAGAEKEFRRSLEFKPNYAEAHHWYAHYLTALGKMDEALAESQRALDLDPLAPIMHEHICWQYMMVRQPDRAIERCRREVEATPDLAQLRLHLGNAYLEKRMPEKAVVEFQRALSASRDNALYRSALLRALAQAGRIAQAEKFLNEMEMAAKQKYISPLEIAAACAGLGRNDEAVAWLGRAYANRSYNMPYLNVDPRWDPLRTDPRFQALLRRMNLPQ